MAAIPLLETKFYIPPWRSGLVSRLRLLEPMGRGQKLTLVSAPAGFGKTTLLAEWTATSDSPAVWLSLDQGDNDPTVFWAYFLNTLQKIHPNLGERVLSLLQSPQPPPIESVLITLINEISTVERRFALVLDDYHGIENQVIHGAIAFLLDHLPPQLHLVIASRSDPPFPLARLRARGELSELRVADLRFTPDEAATFLNQRMQLDISAADVEALENRTEGWIVGLQLAALSMQGRADTTQFIRAFTGSHHFILDYLVEEVLQRQPDPVHSFLLQTSILQRLSGPLCDAVTQQANGSSQLEALERGNLFVVPLDDQRQWYRYHHLFADVLQTRLLKEQPGQLPALHGRASQWYERHEFSGEAIHHALMAEEFERAADLVELHWRSLTRCYQYATVMGWMQSLPDEQIRVRPVLCAGYAWALMGVGDLEAAEPYLQAIANWLDPNHDSDPARMVVVNTAEYQSLPATLATARAYQAQTLGQMANTVRYAQQALDLLPENDYIQRAGPASLLGLTYWARGDLNAAHQAFSDVVSSFQMAGDVPNTVDLSYVLADIRAAQGHLHQAFKDYQRALQMAINHTAGQGAMRGTASLYVGISELYREWNNLAAATQQLHLAQGLDAPATLPDWQYRHCMAQARLKEAQGDLDGALHLLDTAEQIYYRSPMPDVRPIGAIRARVWVKQGRLTKALSWVQERDLCMDDIAYLHEFEQLTLVRIFIAQYRQTQQLDDPVGPIHGVSTLLDRLLKAATATERRGSLIEILVLQALLHEAKGNLSAALDPLQQALVLAEPEGYVRLFVDQGAPMAALLQKAAKQNISPVYISQLRSAFEPISDQGPAGQNAIDPLSQRELEVLRLLTTELTGPEIASELMVSLNTLRTHTKNIYSKLGANNRRAAVRRAEELGLL